MTSTIRTASLALVIAATVSVSTAVQLPNATPSTAQRTGLIIGQVIDASTGAGVSEAIVRAVRIGSPETFQTWPAQRVMTDDEGRFFFDGLAAGDYDLEATRDGFASGQFGQRQPFGQSQRLTLGEAEGRTDVELRIWKFAVIGGTVTDEAGEPVVGTTVRALIKDALAGRASYGSSDFIEPDPAVTDDRGIFRLSRVAPGSYVVVVPSTHGTVPAALVQNLSIPVRNELFRAGMQEVAPPGQPRSLQVGDFALMTLSRVLIPPPLSATGGMQVYPTIFYPAARTAATATPVTVQAGEERTDLSLNMRPVPAVRVAGRLITPDGSAPPPTSIRLIGDTMTGVVTPTVDSVSLDVATGLSDTTGRFMLLGVPSGSYVLRQANPFLTAAVQQGQPAYWFAQPVSVGRSDINDLVVELRPALRIEGRVELRRSPGSQAGPPPRILGVNFDTPFGEPGRAFASIDGETMTFSTVAAAGRFIARASEPSGWDVESITLDGKDITDRVFDLQTDATSFVISYTDRTTKVSGTVTSATGTPGTTAIVIVFPTDRKEWSGTGTSPRRLKTTLTNRSGGYMLEHLPPGDYFAIAVEPADADRWRDPARLELLSAMASRLRVNRSESSTTLDLRVAEVR